MLLSCDSPDSPAPEAHYTGWSPPFCMLRYWSASASSSSAPLRSSYPAGSVITKISQWICVSILQSMRNADDLNWLWCACERRPFAAASGLLGSRSPPRCPSAHREPCSNMLQTLQRGFHWNHTHSYLMNTCSCSVVRLCCKLNIIVKWASVFQFFSNELIIKSTALLTIILIKVSITNTSAK